MEWIETTGRSIAEAKDRALDELGVDETDAEFEVVSDAEIGLFGRLRRQARVRARVRPTAPRPKDDRRRRDRRRPANASAEPSTQAPDAVAEPSAVDAKAEAASDDDEADDAPTGTSSRTAEGNGTPAARKRRRSRSRSGGSGGGRPNSGTASAAADTPDAATSPSAGAHSLMAEGDAGEDHDRKGQEVEVALEEQAGIAAEFLRGLVSEMGLEATVTVGQPEDESIEIKLAGKELGILIGPKGATLAAVQNLARTVVFNETGATNGHLNVDVGGYRQKRTEALTRFATSIAEQVKQSGRRTVLEPMAAVDRKVVHDTISGIDGVTTSSEGEEPRRRVVVSPS